MGLFDILQPKKRRLAADQKLRELSVRNSLAEALAAPMTKGGRERAEQAISAVGLAREVETVELLCDALQARARLGPHGIGISMSACEALVKIGEPAVASLCRILGRSPDASETLVEIGAPAVLPLCRFLRDVDLDSNVRTLAAVALVKIGIRIKAPAEGEPWIALLETDAGVRKTAAVALEHDESAAARLVELDRRALQAQFASAEATGDEGEARLTAKKIFDELRLAVAEMRERDTPFRRAAVRMLLDLLVGIAVSGLDSDVRRTAVQSLVDLFDELVYDRTLKFEVKNQLATALARVDDQLASHALLRALETGNAYDEVAVPRLLESGELKALAAFLQCASPNRSAANRRKWVLSALPAALPSATDFNLLMSTISEFLHDENVEVREQSILALGRITDDRVVPLLVAALDDARERIKGSDSCGHLIENADTRTRWAAVSGAASEADLAARLLNSRGDPRAAGAILRFLSRAMGSQGREPSPPLSPDPVVIAAVSTRFGELLDAILRWRSVKDESDLDGLPELTAKMNATLLVYGRYLPDSVLQRIRTLSDFKYFYTIGGEDGGGWATFEFARQRVYAKWELIRRRAEPRNVVASHETAP